MCTCKTITSNLTSLLYSDMGEKRPQAMDTVVLTGSLAYRLVPGSTPSFFFVNRSVKPRLPISSSRPGPAQDLAGEESALAPCNIVLVRESRHEAI